MSLNIQKCLRERRIYGDAAPRNLKRVQQYPFDEQIYSDRFTLSHMALKKELGGHTGCVNTLDWSMTGDKLLTGSDDTKLNIYQTFENYKLVETIDTGHRANIFTAKFMPQTSDAIIVSGAGDSEVRIFDLHNTGQKLDSMYVCHSDQLKKVCVYHDNPFEFLTCSQDGTIRHFDRRVYHLCSSHKVRSFISGELKKAVQNPVPNCHDLHYGCPRPIVNYGKYKIELNCMTINQRQPHYFAIAGMNDYIYLHDRRMLPSHYTTSKDALESLKCVKRFSHSLDGINRSNKHITACRFSDSNGYELLGSWSGDGIYLFNINDDTVESSTRPTANTTNTTTNVTANTTINATNATTASLSPREQKKQQWQRILHLLKSHQFDLCLEALNNFAISNNINDALGEACLAVIQIACTSYRRYERDSWYQGSDEAWHRYFFDHELDMMKEKLQEAERDAANATPWQGQWCLAIGYWLLRGGVNPIPQVDRKGYLERALEACRLARHYHDQDLDSLHIQMMDKLMKVLERTQRRELSEDQQEMDVDDDDDEDEDDEDEDDDINIWKWAELMYIDIYNVNEISTLLHIPFTESPSNDDGDSDGDDNDDNDVTLYTDIMGTPLMDLYTSGGNDSNDNEDSDSDSDLDFEELAIFQGSSTLQNFETDVGVVKPRMKYTGHRNTRTVKDVDFFGLHDEYVVSGSDDGNLFVWDKKSGQIVEILQADGEIVNVAKGHPHLPILAVSGIDSTTKIFTPTSRNPSTSRIMEPNNPSSYSTSSVMHNREAIIATNQENNLDSDIYITRSMIAALTRIGRRHRIHILTDGPTSDDSDDTTMYYPPHGIDLTDEDMSNSRYAESSTEEEETEENEDEEIEDEE